MNTEIVELTKHKLIVLAYKKKLKMSKSDTKVTHADIMSALNDNLELQKLTRIICELLVTELINTNYADLIKKTINKINNEIHLDIPSIYKIQIYDKITKDKINLPVKTIFVKKAKGYSLQIRADYYMTKNIVPAILAQQILKFYVAKLLTESVASDVACSLVWNLILDKEQKRKFYNYWIELHPPNFILGPTLKFNFADFVRNITKIAGKKTYIELLQKIQIQKIAGVKLNTEQSAFFPFEAIKLSLADIRIQELVAMKYAIDAKTTVKQKIVELAGKNRTAISQSLKALQQSFLLRERVFYFPQSIGLHNYYMIYRVKTSNANLSVLDEYPLTKSTNTFIDYETTYYTNFYTIDSKYANAQTSKWIQNLYAKSEDSVKIVAPLIIGKELPEYRFEAQNPQLYNPIDKKWTMGKTKIPFSKQQVPRVELLDSATQKIIMQMIQRPYTIENIYKKIGGNKNKVYRIAKRLQENKIITKRFVLPFYDELFTLLFIHNGEEQNYINFVETVTSRVPLGLAYRLQSADKYFGISFLSVPHDYIMRVISAAKSIDHKIRILALPKAMGSSKEVSLQQGKTGWKYQKLPTVHFEIEK